MPFVLRAGSGQKSGAGFYDYDERRKASQSPVADQLIADFRAARPSPARDISDEEIRARTLYVMVNEAAKVLEEGIAQRASDIDVVWLYGYGWPRVTGGLVNWANETGLDTIVAGLDALCRELGGGRHDCRRCCLIAPSAACRLNSMRGNEARRLSQQ